eukprot:2804237-Amphidinium_carterae.1
MFGKGRHRDLEERTGRALTPETQLHWIKAHQKEGCAAEHVPHEPTADWLHWELVAKSVRHVRLLVGPKLRERPEAWPRLCRHLFSSKTFRLSCQWKCYQPVQGAL